MLAQPIPNADEARPSLPRKRGMAQENYARHERLILQGTRQLMKRGTFQPSVVEIARASGCSQRCIFEHHPRRSDLWLSALADAETRDAILQRILGVDYSVIGAPEEWFERIARAAVTGAA